jgi:hypothetical protein
MITTTRGKMTTLTQFDIEFFSLSEILKKPLTEELKVSITRILLKLNNPTYYGKYVKKNPIELHGYQSRTTSNPVLLAISAMLLTLKTDSDYLSASKKLQTEFAWAFNNYPKYSAVNL